MKSIINFILLTAGLTVLLIACDKVGDLPSYGNGTTPVLSASATAVAPLPADSNNTALTFNWTFAKYATDSATMKYTIEIDSTGKNFARASSKIVLGKLTTPFTAKELNTILLSYGYAFNVPVDMEVRLISSYGNNNERLISNVLKIRMTPYKIPPKVALPSSLKLFIVGDATAGGWNNPVPVPSQEFTKTSSTTYELTTPLVGGGKHFLLLPENGSWSKKYAVENNSLAGLEAGGEFKAYSSGGQDIPGPLVNGNYKITVDFQEGTFKVIKL